MAKTSKRRTARNQIFSDGGPGSDPRFLSRFAALAMPFWRLEEGWGNLGLGLFLVVLTVAQVCVPVALNLWNEQLFDSLERREMSRFLMLVGVLAAIIVANVAITVTHLTVKRRLQVAWRRWLTYRVFRGWMNDGRQYLVNFVPGEHDNPDGRIAEDIRIATESAIDLAHSLFYSALLLISFTKILWSLSGPSEVRFGDFEVYLPGHLVWIAILYSVLGTVVASALGRPLVKAVDRRQTDEANFRFGLVHARENAMAIALLSGEVGERRHFRTLFRDVVLAWDRQTSALAHIFYFTSSWSVLSQVFPYMVAAPRYIAGAISLGVLMQTAQAFGQMTNALSWPIDNLAGVAEWRASVERVLNLVKAVDLVPEHFAAREREGITVADSERPVLAFSDLEVTEADGTLQVSQFSAAIRKGERVLLTGDPGAAVTLFKVTAGLWPWGRGRVDLPEGGGIFFMPRRPYLPTGPLRQAVMFPLVPKPRLEKALTAALSRVGLTDFIERLNESRDWEQSLAVGEQQRLGFARLLLHDPEWIFIQEATDGLDRDAERDMMTLLFAEYPQATVMTISHRTSMATFHHRCLRLVRFRGLTVVEDAPLAS